MKPTASPWRIEAVSDAVRIVVGQGRSKIILARLCPTQIKEDETWANARLMVAAPDLFAALQDMMKRHDERCGCQDPGEELCPGIAVAREALAKAQGLQKDDC
jgi:hypothetical protein